MSEPVNPLTIQLLDWLLARPRTHGDVIETWRSTCPRLSVWEDAVIEGLARYDGERRLVMLTDRGRALLASAKLLTE
ncbi:MAG: hypothetical protein EXQ87_07145 [Alphaproteobacteria bacterium]|nr:hypothetical protein [Alphaproteobacteria bacterium]